jgi:cob(I)yrinic acid a,c-diamide adenosyltransferase (EC 2.5.1.17)
MSRKKENESKKSSPAPATIRGKFKGYIQVYTGDGKGKTTAALGLALRAAGHNFRTYIGQFLKGQHYGELDSIKKLAPLITLEQFGRKKFIKVTENFEEEDYKLAEQGLRKCLKAMLSGEYKIVILDEINVAMYFGLIKEEAVQKFLDQKPEDVEVVLTGRYAPVSIMERADLVTEMVNRKHYYDKGVQARKGIEK